MTDTNQGGKRPGAGRPTIMENGRRITIWVPERTLREISQRARDHECSHGAVVREALDDFFGDD